MLSMHTYIHTYTQYVHVPASMSNTPHQGCVRDGEDDLQPVVRFVGGDVVLDRLSLVGYHVHRLWPTELLPEHVRLRVLPCERR